MDNPSMRYRTLGEDSTNGSEVETALDNANSMLTQAQTGNGSGTDVVTSGDESASEAVGFVEPKISGKAWGRVLKFFLGIRQYPKAIGFILGNEFCERFTYYGFKAVLILYLTEHMKYSDSSGTAIYHAFVALSYFSPLPGAMLSDGWIGKYKTILYLSIVHAFGNLFLAVTSVPLGNVTATKVVPLIGLLLTAIGTGGIKPCVSAFGGDQFRPDQSHLLQRYFSIFYFSINAGSCLAIATPFLRAETCFGSDCYMYAFGLPAVFMIVATIIFVAGHRYYIKDKPTGNVIAMVARAIALGARRRFTNRGSLEKKDHWIYWADDKYDRKFLDDVRDVLRVVVLLTPVPVFWTLFDQMGSRWTLQAKKMDGRLGNGVVLEPDQMQNINAFLILLFIPLFESIIYPLLRFFRLPMRPLQRMSAGMILAGLSFVVTAFLQIRVENSLDAYPVSSISRLRVVNALPSGLDVTVTRFADGSAIFNQSLPYGQATSFGDFAPGNYTVSVQPLDGTARTSARLSFSGRSVNSIVVAYSGDRTSIFPIIHDVSTLNGEEFAVRVLNCNPSAAYSNVYMTLEHRSDRGQSTHDFNHSISHTGIGLFEQSTRAVVRPPANDWLFQLYDGATNQSLHNATFVFDNDGMYTIVLRPNSSDDSSLESVVRMVDVLPSGVSILWQVPQYAVITAGEIMFSITGLEFVYSQGPKSMKSVMQAVWLLTVAFGNLIVVIVAEAEFFESRVSEYIFFAGVIGIVTILFIVMSVRYTYVGNRSNVSNSGTELVERYKRLQDDSDLATSESSS